MPAKFGPLTLIVPLLINMLRAGGRDGALIGKRAAAPGARNPEGIETRYPPEAPWMAPRAEEWDATTLHEWLAAHVGPMAARRMLATAIEGVFARNSTPP